VLGFFFILGAAGAEDKADGAGTYDTKRNSVAITTWNWLRNKRPILHLKLKKSLTSSGSFALDSEPSEWQLGGLLLTESRPAWKLEAVYVDHRGRPHASEIPWGLVSASRLCSGPSSLHHLDKTNKSKTIKGILFSLSKALVYLACLRSGSWCSTDELEDLYKFRSLRSTWQAPWREARARWTFDKVRNWMCQTCAPAE